MRKLNAVTKRVHSAVTLERPAQQESPCALLLLDDSEDCLDQPLSQPVSFFGSRRGHPGAMETQHFIMRPYSEASSDLFGCGTGSEGWACQTDSTWSSVQSQWDIVHVLYADERERLSLGTPEAVTVLVIGESALVIWVFEEPLACL